MTAGAPAQAAIATAQAAIATTQAGNAAASAGASATSAGSSATSATAAQTAQTAAETARDAAQASGNIYATTAAGITATNATTNKYFSIPSASGNGYLDLYLNNSGSAVLQKTYPSSSAVTASYQFQSDAKLASLSMISQLSVTGSSVWNLDFSTPAYAYGSVGMTVPALPFTRAGSGEAIGGAARQTFGYNLPRILNGAMQLDAGGTNQFLYSEDFTQAVWTKTNVTLGAAITGPAGAGTAIRIEETSATGTHEIRQTVTSTATVWTMQARLLPSERTAVRLQITSNATGAPGCRAEFTLTGGGSVANVVGIGAPAGTGVTATIAGPDAQGFYLCAVSVTLPSAPTTVIGWITMMSAGATSYAGTAGSGIGLFGPMLDSVAQPVSYIQSGAAQGTRAPEYLTMPIQPGCYLIRTLGKTTDVVSALSVSLPGTINVTPNAGETALAKSQVVKTAAFDNFSRADTADGTLGVATDGGTYSLLQYNAGYPLVASVKGRVQGGWFVVTPVSGVNGTVYAVRDVLTAAKYISASIKWGTATTGGDAVSNMSFAMLLSASLTNLTQAMPVHIVITRSGVSIQKRDISGTFTTLGTIATNFQINTVYTCDIRLYGNVLRVSMGGQTVVVTDPGFTTACRYVCWEIQATSNNTTGDAMGKDFIATTATVGEAPTYAATAPANTAIPFASGTPVSGSLYSVSSTFGSWTSNAGQQTYTYQWQLNGADVSGATGVTFQTTAGTDAGKTVSVRVTATNTIGSTSATSLPSAPLS